MGRAYVGTNAAPFAMLVVKTIEIAISGNYGSIRAIAPANKAMYTALLVPNRSDGAPITGFICVGIARLIDIAGFCKLSPIHIGTYTLSGATLSKIPVKWCHSPFTS